MTLLGIGKDGLNTDNVAARRIYEPGEIENYHPTDEDGSPGYNPEANRRRVVRIETTALVGGEIESSSSYQIELFGDDADAFVHWLNANATNLTPVTEEDMAFEEYRANGGAMARASWERVWSLHKQHVESGRISPYEGDLGL